MDDDGVGRWVRAASSGDQSAWSALVDRFAGLVWAVARSHGLAAPDAADVSQTTWLRLVEHLDRIEQPERVGAWLATTARRESLAVLRRGGRQFAAGSAEDVAGTLAGAVGTDSGLLEQEERAALAAAFARLAERCQQLLRVLMADPPPHYDEVAAALDIPIGSIGPTRARCLQRLQVEMSSAGT